MKSKAEILKAVDTCAHASGRCIDCPYCDDTAYCVDHLVADLREALIKSDFEVISEIMSRSKNACMDNHSDIQGDLVIKAHLDLCFNFDTGGNIL